MRPQEEVNPLEKRFRYDPMPLPWFDNAPARAVFRDPDPEHWLLSRLSGKHLAGYSGRPSGAELFRWLTEGAQTELQRAWLAELLCDIREEVYPQLRRRDALSIWHIARAALECDVKRGALSRWLNQFAVMPEDWRPEAPGSGRRARRHERLWRQAARGRNPGPCRSASAGVSKETRRKAEARAGMQGPSPYGAFLSCFHGFAVDDNRLGRSADLPIIDIQADPSDSRPHRGPNGLRSS